MNATTKTLIPNQEWIIESEGEKIGSVVKIKKGYVIYRKGSRSSLKSKKEIIDELGISLQDTTSIKKFTTEPEEYFIYEYPCSSKPFEPIYNLKKRLPLFAKSIKSKSKYCAGYYIIQFRKGWVKSFCPKLITLERYPYQGPYKTEIEMKEALTSVKT